MTRCNYHLCFRKAKFRAEGESYYYPNEDIEVYVCKKHKKVLEECGNIDMDSFVNLKEEKRRILKDDRKALSI